MEIKNLKLAVNRQPLFPRGGPEELAELQNVPTKSVCQANLHKHHVTPHPQQLSIHTLGLEIMYTMRFCVYTNNYVALSS